MIQVLGCALEDGEVLMSFREKFFDQLKVVLSGAINQYASQCGGKHFFLNRFIVKFDDESLNPSDNHSVNDAMYALQKFNEFMSAAKISARLTGWSINESIGIDYNFIITDIRIGDRCLSVCYVEDLHAIVEGDLLHPFPLGKVGELEWRVAYEKLVQLA